VGGAEGRGPNAQLKYQFYMRDGGHEELEQKQSQSQSRNRNQNQDFSQLQRRALKSWQHFPFSAISISSRPSVIADGGIKVFPAQLRPFHTFPFVRNVSCTLSESRSSDV